MPEKPNSAPKRLPEPEPPTVPNPGITEKKSEDPPPNRDPRPDETR